MFGAMPHLHKDAVKWQSLWSIRAAMFWGAFNGGVLGMQYIVDGVTPFHLMMFGANILGYATIAGARLLKQPGLDNAAD